MAAATRRSIDSLTCVILAAGGSSRLGRPKQLIRVRGKPLLIGAVDAAAACGEGPPVVVLGAQSIRLRALLRRSRPGVIVAVNPRWREGLSTSMQSGLAALHPRTAAALFVLSDQPWVGAAQLKRLIDAWRKRPRSAAAARYGGRLGVPAIVPRRLWPRLLAVTGDSGARAVLQRTAEVIVVDMPEAAFDVDLPAHAERLRAAAPSARTQDEGARRSEERLRIRRRFARAPHRSRS